MGVFIRTGGVVTAGMFGHFRPQAYPDGFQFGEFFKGMQGFVRPLPLCL